jgi:lipopolysaccharide transport system ATP-binding protein
MSELIRIEGVSKRYRLGVINRGMLYKDIQSWWARKTGREDPHTVVGVEVNGNRKFEENGEFWALQDINLSIQQGDSLGVIGRNGAGKSTLLKILSRTTSPTKGKIYTRGRIASLLEVGTGFHPELTGRENVYLNGAILGMSRKEVKSKFDEIVDFAEISEFINTPVKRYSSGMYVRLAFAVAAHLDPEVLIVDEVLAVGDANFQRKCIGKMGKVAKDGRTVILVSHSMVMVESLTQKCLWLHNGKTKRLGDSKTVAAEYLKFSQEQQLGTTEGLHDYRLRRGTGEVRLKDFQTLNLSSQLCTEFVRGDTICFRFEVEVFKKCRELAILIGFKLGMSGEMLLQTPRHILSEHSLQPGKVLDAQIHLDTKIIPAALYDLYIWLGPIKEIALNEYYDIADGLLPPLKIFDNTISNVEQKTTLNSKISLIL